MRNLDVTGALPSPLPHTLIIFRDSRLLRRAKHPCEAVLSGEDAFWAALSLQIGFIFPRPGDTLYNPIQGLL
jgi:hypothetical protein